MLPVSLALCTIVTWVDLKHRIGISTEPCYLFTLILVTLFVKWEMIKAENWRMPAHTSNVQASLSSLELPLCATEPNVIYTFCQIKLLPNIE